MAYALPADLPPQANGEARFMLERELMLAPRLGIFGEVEYHTLEKWSYQASTSYALTQYLSMTALTFRF